MTLKVNAKAASKLGFAPGLGMYEIAGSKNAPWVMCAW